MKDKWHFLLQRTDRYDEFGKRVEMAGLVYNFHHHQIVALKGGKNYKKSQFNRAFYTLRPMDHTILPFLGVLLKSKGTSFTHILHPPTQETLEEALQNRDLFLLASELKKYGFGSLYRLFQWTDHHPKRNDSELLIGAERVSLATLARMLSALLTLPSSLPRTSLIQHIHARSHGFSPQMKEIAEKTLRPHAVTYQRPKNIVRTILKHLSQSTDCTLSLSSITSRRDDYWSIYISANTVTVIWMGSERGSIQLPALSYSQARSYENLGKHLAISLCLENSKT